MTDTSKPDFYQLNADRLAKNYESYPCPFLEHFRNFLIPKSLVADLGCGSGRDAQVLLDLGFEVRAYDSSPRMLELATALHPNVAFEYAELPFLKEIADQTFDNVLCSGVLNSIPKNSLATCINNIARITKLDGCILMSFKNNKISTDQGFVSTVELDHLLDSIEAAECDTNHIYRTTDSQRPQVSWTTVAFRKRKFEPNWLS